MHKVLTRGRTKETVLGCSLTDLSRKLPPQQQDPAHRDCAPCLELSELLGGLLSTLVDGVGEDVEADGLAEGSALA